MFLIQLEIIPDWSVNPILFNFETIHFLYVGFAFIELLMLDA